MAWKTDNDLENSDPVPNSGDDTEWPCKPRVESSGWPTSWTNDSNKSKLKTPSPTPEDEAANNSQLPALLVVAEYLNSTLSLDDDDEFSEYIGEDGEFLVNVDEEENGFQDYDFFAKLFKEDDGLREYYEKNWESGGIFCCLVCCGVREKGWKRFKDCSSLVQHSTSIAKTSKRRAHRAYCKVVCEVLGWDVNQLPSIVPSVVDKKVKAEWPCKPVVELSGWPSSWENDSNKSKLQTPAPTPEDEAANNSQLPALLLVAKYLNSTLCLDDDDEFVEYIGEDGQFFINGDEEENGFQDYDFFAKLFKEDDGLREYYEKNKENGIFCCLVCCGVREKGWKRFKDCSSLVQHSISIAKTSKRRAHRAYCKVVCEVLGWDVNSLPTIVPSAGDKQVKAQHLISIAKTSKRHAHQAYCQVFCEILGWDVNSLHSIVLSAGNKPVKAQGNVDDGGDDSLNSQCKSTISGSISDAEASLSKLSLIDENQQGKDCCSAKLEHNSLSGATVDRSLGDLSKGISETTEENAEGVVNCAENSVTKAGVDGLLEGLSDLTLETQKGNAKGASDCVVPFEETGQSSNPA